MNIRALGAAFERQVASRFRTATFWIGAIIPVLVIGLLLLQTGRATGNPAPTMFLAVLSALWIGGSACVREIVDERKLVRREPHLSLLAYGLAKILYAAFMAAGQSLILGVFLQWSGVVMMPLFSLWAVLFLTALSGGLLALILSAFCEEPGTALAWFPLLLVPQVVFGGFLFVYGSTIPFAPSNSEPGIAIMPEELRREPVESGVLRAAGALAVSRWALESLAAETFAQDLADQEQLENAIQVANTIPLTLSGDSASETLLRHMVESEVGRAVGVPVGAPVITTHRAWYFLILMLFAAVQAGLLVVILPLRDPRRS